MESIKEYSVLFCAFLGFLGGRFLAGPKIPRCHWKKMEEYYNTEKRHREMCKEDGRDVDDENHKWIFNWNEEDD